MTRVGAYAEAWRRAKELQKPYNVYKYQWGEEYIVRSADLPSMPKIGFWVLVDTINLENDNDKA